MRDKGGGAHWVQVAQEREPYHENRALKGRDGIKLPLPRVDIYEPLPDKISK